MLQAGALHAGGLAQQSDQLFNTMVNATSPTAHMGQRRGVFDGGSLQARNRIVSESLMHVTPPSFEAGCGGIDLYAGSFSFINADQFQALMRAIAANATGYAFQMALAAMSPQAAEIISKLQDTVQKLNSAFADSCQLAQGLVNDAASALDGVADLQDLADPRRHRYRRHLPDPHDRDRDQPGHPGEEQLQRRSAGGGQPARQYRLAGAQAHQRRGPVRRAATMRCWRPS